MPDVELHLDIAAPADVVWEAVVDIERYPQSMENVRTVTITREHSATHRESAWSVILQGSILQWEEADELDPKARIITFHQLSGDLLRFDGRWLVEPCNERASLVHFRVSFEIGIPLLADMLNPVAQRSLRENCIDMLRGIERESVGQ